MTAAPLHALVDDRPKEDHFVRLRGVSWSDYQRLLEIRGECSTPRITYLEGLLEIMSPSRSHLSIAQFLDRPSTSQAIRDYRDALRR